MEVIVFIMSGVLPILYKCGLFFNLYETTFFYHEYTYCISMLKILFYRNNLLYIHLENVFQYIFKFLY